MSQDLSGKVAVVTGGSSGIGKGIAQRLKEAGATVVIAGLDETKLANVATELGVTGIPVDVTKPESVQALADAVVARFGKVDVICNNAGVGSMGRIADLSLEDWKWMLDVNLWGVIHGVSSFLPILKANPDGGHVINIASMASLDANPNMGAYTASKMAVLGLTEVLAKESAEEGGKIKASCMCPGPVYSDIKNSLRHKPAGAGSGLFDVDATQDSFMATLRWMDPLEVGDQIVDAIGTDEVYLITHPELWPPVATRFAAIQNAFGV